MTTSIAGAIRSGARRGMILAADPRVGTYRKVRSSPQDPAAQAWEMTGHSIRSAMTKNSQKTRSRGSRKSR